MANLADPKTPGFPAVYQLELTDRVKAGAGGIANRQAEQLVERTAFLKKQIDDIVSGALVAEYADRLKTPRVIAMTGDGAWSVTFDGNGNVSSALTLANSGVAAGSYGIVTVDAKGRVTAGRQMTEADVPALSWSKVASGKPNTLDGYGITDGQVASPDLTALANLKGAAGIYVNTGPGSAVVRTLTAGQGVTISNGDGKSGNPTIALTPSGVAAGSYGIVTVDAMGRVTAGRQMGGGDVPAHDWSKVVTGKPTTLAGYGISDAYTKAETDNKLGGAPGSIVLSFAESPPTGALVCNGAAVSRIAYPALFVAIGTKYGAGDGKNTFNLPNVQDGFALLAANGNGVGSTVTGAVIQHTHGANASADSSGEHSHGVNDPGHSHAYITRTEIGGNAGGSPNIVWKIDQTIRTSSERTGISIAAAGGHGHNVGVNIHSNGGDCNYAAGVRVLVCITY
ncbi:tail fiber protein [Chromobacterium piscinae]|uniref:phage tail protein n=1 Tax=Chromobacterium piscinae TaxID=686831 RepID=UPI001E2C3555|nr:tail fiber protein [Chromobacterium piscinae]MCD4505518.1 tail fiber protein [Chromobacterium piscinae]